jgi:CSLREA domain-containing protein/MYXO-CTERM domain-containing protein
MKRNSAFSAIVGILAATALSTLAQAASITPNTTLDGTAPTPDCTLREAITSVNTNTASGGCTATGAGAIDTVELPAGAYVLDITSTDDDNTSGDLDVLADITINGAGADTTSISAQGLQDGDNPERVLHINAQFAPTLTATVRGVTIRDGLEEDDNGGGILIQSEQNAAFNLLTNKLGTFLGTSVTLEGIVVTENAADQTGGGISNFGAQLFIGLDSEITNNDSNQFGGGVASFTDVGVTSLDISNTLVDNNEAFIGSGVGSDGSMTMQTTTVSNNHDACIGGGITIDGEALIFDTTVNGNDATGPCPAIEGVTATNVGGGIALDTDSSATLVNTTISGNSATDGGGGIVVAFEPPTQPISAGAIKLGVVVDNPGLHLFNVTIAENDTDGIGGGVASIGIAPTGNGNLFTAANTIIAGNIASDGEGDAGNDCAVDFTSLGYNLIGNFGACNGFTATGDQTGVDPNLGPLQDNGGPTATHALLEGSLAIDTANPAGCDDGAGGTLNADQRGFIRPVNATGLAEAICDIGAYEFQVEASPTPTPTAIPGFLLNGTGCALTAASAGSSAPAALTLLAGLAGLAYRRIRRRAE